MSTAPVTVTERTVGHRTILNTDWPVVRKLQKYGRKWQIVEVCNGTCESLGTFRRLADARAVY